MKNYEIEIKYRNLTSKKIEKNTLKAIKVLISDIAKDNTNSFKNIL